MIPDPCRWQNLKLNNKFGENFGEKHGPWNRSIDGVNNQGGIRWYAPESSGISKYECTGTQQNPESELLRI